VPNQGVSEVTRLLRAWHAGDDDAYRRASAILYSELRRQAARYIRRKRTGDALQPTMLVHETFLRLNDAGAVDWQDRRHFLAVAARTMRQVTIDLSREEAAAKRGGGVAHVVLDSNVADRRHGLIDLIAVDEALDALAAVDPRKVQVVELRFFAGLTVEEAARVLEVSPDTVARDWRFARAWLLRLLDSKGTREHS